MNDITVIFKSKNPDEISLWKERTDLSYRRWQRQVEHLKRELRIGDPVLRTDFRECWIIGYRPNNGTAPVLGFRRDSKIDYFVPDTFSAEGKEVAERMSSLRYTIGEVPGLPNVVRGKESVGSFRLEKLGLVWFATLRFPVWKKNLTGVDSTLWEHSNLDEYRRMTELQEILTAEESRPANTLMNQMVNWRQTSDSR